LLNFLRDNRVYTVNEYECSKLLKFFDSDEDGRLSYTDFSQMLLPCEDNFLRKYIQDRPSKYVGRYDYLDFDIERRLADLIEAEIF
jgi:Ca2+-binding EF-hand superfamily protein